MRASQYIKKIVSVVLFILLTLITLSGLTFIMEDKESERRLNGFFQEDKEIDVLLFGSSHIRHGIFPMELFQDYGIVSYNLAGNGDTIPVSYWKLKMALEYQHPKLVIMDVYDLWPNEKVSKNGIGQVHTSIDAFPLSYNKYKAVMDLFETPKEQMEMIWTYSTYHTRWTSLTEGDFDVDYTSSLCRGSLPLAAVKSRTILEDTTPDEDLVYDTMSADYLERMIALCQDNNIEVLLVNTGYDASKATQLFADSAPLIAEQYGIGYVDFVSEPIINFDTDLHSSKENTHVNCSGALKLTDFLGRYIKKNYDIPDKLEDERYEDWASDYEKYVEYKLANISGEASIESQLMLLADDDFSMCIYANDVEKLISNKTIYNLMQNLTGDNRLEFMDEKGNGEGRYCLVVDNEKGEIVEKRGEDFNLETSFGEVVFGTENGKPALYIGDRNTNRLDGEWFNTDSTVSKPDVQVFVINNYNHEVVSSSKWYFAEPGAETGAMERRES